jgi:hypothetical protein
MTCPKCNGRGHIILHEHTQYHLSFTDDGEIVSGATGAITICECNTAEQIPEARCAIERVVATTNSEPIRAIRGTALAMILLLVAVGLAFALWSLWR